MGTHPIFESDFDCLTECFQSSPDPLSLLPSDSVTTSLRPPPDSGEIPPSSSEPSSLSVPSSTATSESPSTHMKPRSTPRPITSSLETATAERPRCPFPAACSLASTTTTSTPLVPDTSMVITSTISTPTLVSSGDHSRASSPAPSPAQEFSTPNTELHTRLVRPNSSTSSKGTSTDDTTSRATDFTHSLTKFWTAAQRRIPNFVNPLFIEPHMFCEFD